MAIVPGSKLNKDIQGSSVDATRYKQLVGSLFYLTSTRPDMMFITSLLSRYMNSPTEMHRDCGLWNLHKHTTENRFMGYTDSDHAGDEDDSRSTSGYVFMLSSRVISWSSKKQPIGTLSSTEAEYVAAVIGACQAVWLKGILKQLGYEEGKCTSLMSDNTSTIKLSKNPVFHGRSRHIRVRNCWKI